MAVHDIEMDPVGAGLVDRADLLAQPGEVGGEDRGGNKDGSLAWRLAPAGCGQPSCRPAAALTMW